MDKFTIKRNCVSPAAFKPIQIRESTYEMLKQILDDTGGSMVDLVDAMVRFCAERLEIED